MYSCAYLQIQTEHTFISGDMCKIAMLSLQKKQSKDINMLVLV